MICTDRRLRLCKALIGAMLVFIWGNSLLPGELSQAFSDWVKTLLVMLFPGNDSGHSGSGLLRKIAHFSEFAALGVLLSWFCGMKNKRKSMSMVCGVAVACVDEIIQAFVPGRSPALKDVAIDSCGVLTGLVLLRIGYTVLKKRSTQSYFGG